MTEALKSDEAVNKMGGRFKLAVLVQKRLVDVTFGAPLLVERGSKTLMEAVIQEVLEGKITLEIPKRPPPGTRPQPPPVEPQEDEQEEVTKRPKSVAYNEVLEFLKKPETLMNMADIETDESREGASNGVYGWYFDEIPAMVPTDGCITRKGFTLLYVGKGKRLRDRILNMHFKGTHKVSTLRKSLRAVLSLDEDSLTEWMAKHGRVAYIVVPLKIDATEVQLIRDLPLPLNIEHNTQYPEWTPKLSKMRKEIE